MLFLWMKIRLVLFFVISSGFCALPMLGAQELDGSDLRQEVRQRDERVSKLTLDEQLKLRAAQVKAAEDPTVKEALRKRNEAINQFRAAIQAAMIKADPSVAPILEKVAIRAKLQP